jgi:hypothetical protein
MKRSAVLAVAVGLIAVGCGGVDREGTRDNLIEELSAAGVDMDADCVDAALDKLSDDELKAIDEMDPSEPTPESEQLFADIFECAAPAEG